MAKITGKSSAPDPEKAKVFADWIRKTVLASVADTERFRQVMGDISPLWRELMEPPDA